jgi:hypothetical protein
MVGHEADDNKPRTRRHANELDPDGATTTDEESVPDRRSA